MALKIRDISLVSPVPQLLFGSKIEWWRLLGHGLKRDRMNAEC